MIYHITTKKSWVEAKHQRTYKPNTLRDNGFIHCSSKNQVALVANLLYKNKKNLVLLEIDEKKVNSSVVFEDLKGHGTFPHIYGELNIDAVINAYDFKLDNKGSFLLPKEIM